jgi:ribose 5-phosphate isomerase B
MRPSSRGAPATRVGTPRRGVGCGRRSIGGSPLVLDAVAAPGGGVLRRERWWAGSVLVLDAVAAPGGGLLRREWVVGWVVAEGRRRVHNATMRIAFGTDDDTDATATVCQRLSAAGHQVRVVGDGEPWPEVGRAVGEAVASGEVDRGVVCCWTGTGVSMAANKVPGVRAALCTDPETAAGARRWNDANVLALGLRLTSPALADEMVAAFLATAPEADEAENIAKLG